MKYAPYTFAAADLISVTLACFAALLFFFALGWAVLRLFNLGKDVAETFSEPDSDATFEDAPDLSETGIACEIAKMAPGTQLVEVDTAGMLTPPAQVFVHEYVWTGSEIKFVRRVPLHEFDFVIPGSAAMHAASHPDALTAREQFLRSFEVGRFDPPSISEVRPVQGGVTSQRVTGDFLKDTRPLRPSDDVRL